MLAALALTVMVQSGQTLSGIASSHGVSLAAVEGANQQISDPNFITVGETVHIPSGGSYSSWTPSKPSTSSPAPSSPVSSSPASGQSSPSSSSGGSGTTSSGSLSSVPGVPSSFAACVAMRESTNGTNQAYNGGVYGIINASGYHVNGQSIAAQKAAFSALYAQYGSAPWAPSDGC